MEGLHIGTVMSASYRHGQDEHELPDEGYKCGEGKVGASEQMCAGLWHTRLQGSSSDRSRL